MRRSIASVLLVTLFACLTPVPADAYFWDWVDSLSGPEFHGTLVEWKVWCKTKRPSEEVKKLLGKAEDTVRLYEAADRESFGFNKEVKEALRAANLSVVYIQAALAALEGRSDVNPRDVLVAALRWRQYAFQQFVFSSQPLASQTDDKRPRRPAEFNLKTDEVTTQMFAGGGPALAVSLCDAGPYERHTRFLNVNVSWGSDNLERNAGDRNTLVTVGASYHAVITPWLSAGLGGGIASFSSGNAPAFRKWYIEPYIVDVRPVRGFMDWWAWCRKPKGKKVEDDKTPSANPWPDVLFVRYSTIIFPTGIEAGRFGGRSPQYPAELIHSYGAHADLEPLIRKMRNRY